MHVQTSYEPGCRWGTQGGNVGGERTLSSNLKCAMKKCDVLTHKLLHIVAGGKAQCCILLNIPLRWFQSCFGAGPVALPKRLADNPPTVTCPPPSSLPGSPACPLPSFFTQNATRQKDTFCYHRAMNFMPPFVAPPSVPVLHIHIYIYIYIYVYIYICFPPTGQKVLPTPPSNLAFGRFGHS